MHRSNSWLGSGVLPRLRLGQHRQYPLDVAKAEEMEEFRQRLISAFPPRPFDGRVSIHDECDEGIALLKELPGKRWDEIPAAFVDFNSGSLPLLEASALVAFLPAWLLRSMETVGDESVLAEFTTYFLCPRSEDEGWNEKEIAERVSLFDAPQRRLIGDFLRSIVEKHAPRYLRPYAEHGVKRWSVWEIGEIGDRRDF